MQLPLGWNTYLLFNFDIVNFARKTDEGEAESIALLFLFFGGALIVVVDRCCRVLYRAS